MNPKTLFTALACALLAVVLSGCGQSNHLQSIQLTANTINGVVQTSQSGIYNLQGDASTIQLTATGTFTDSKTKDLTNEVTYAVVVDPNYTRDYQGNPLLPPCQAPACPSPSSPPFTQGTLEFNSTGLITAVEPAVCTWVQQGTGWFFQGAYQVTASFEGITSQPIYIPIASASGPGTNGTCGPS